ncbi:MAG: methionyl-tRNA formyltransferase [Candidatus Kapaibacteriales bacterium]
MGTPEFAVPVLERLIDSYGFGGKGVVGVVTVADKKKGRGQKVSFSPVKEKALELGISEDRIFQPTNLKDESFAQSLASLEADIFCIVAFRILPESVFSLPKIASFNIHGSLLPKYRGAAPINWAVIKGEKKTGLTSFILQKVVDTGNILLTKEIELGEETSAGQLHDSLMPLAADLAQETIDILLEGNYTPKPQIDSEATPAPKIFKKDCQIDFSKDAQTVHNQIRGLSPYPAAFTTWDGKMVKVLGARVNSADPDLDPFKYKIINNKLIVGCLGRKSIEILEIKPEGKKAMKVEDYLRGYRGEEDGRFEYLEID